MYILITDVCWGKKLKRDIKDFEQINISQKAITSLLLTKDNSISPIKKNKGGGTGNLCLFIEILHFCGAPQIGLL